MLLTPNGFFFCVHMTTHYINEREPMFCAHYSNSYYKSACFLHSNTYILKGIPTDKIYQVTVGMRLGQLSKTHHLSPCTDMVKISFT